MGYWAAKFSKLFIKKCISIALQECWMRWNSKKTIFLLTFISKWACQISSEKILVVKIPI